jgi:arginase
MIYFFKAKSRIGLKNKPLHQTQLNIGVEEGPDAILNSEFLSNFSNSKVAEFEFPKPEDIPDSEFNQVLVESIKGCVSLLDSRLRGNDKKNIQILVGGDHSVVLPSILADLERFKDPNQIGVLHIDSHGDINLYHQSPTKNFHGMYLRPLFDNFDIPEIDDLVPVKIPTSNLMMIGNLDLDPGEKEFLEKNNVAVFPLSRLPRSDKIGPLNDEIYKIKSFINKFNHLHISFDIDVFDQTLAPATGIPAKKGFLWEDIEPILEIIKNHPSFSFDLCEVNPKKKGGVKTVKLAQKILETILI